MMILKINIDGRFFDMELTKEEVDAVKAKNLEDNIAVAKDLNAKLEGQLPPEIINTIVNNHTQHFIYRLTNYAVLKKQKELAELKKKSEWVD